MTEDYHERVVPFQARDGAALNLINLRGKVGPSRGPVLLVHGAGVRSNIFRAPVGTTIVDVLVDHGYDVWLENWRASIDFAPNRWTLDQAAAFDHPAAVETVVAETGWERIKAVIHCQGSTSFTMSAIAGLVPQVDTVITNAVSLHTLVPWWSRQKINFALPAVKKYTDYISPHWGVYAPTWIAKLITSAALSVHHECDNRVCKMVSFTYGAGFPALWLHENLNEATHEWLKEEFAEVPIRFFEQIAECVRIGHLVRTEELNELPKDFTACTPQTDARFVFFTGKKNRCFLPESQIRSFEYFDALRKGFHRLYVLDGYSHLDIFMGRCAAQDVFPAMIEELDRGAMW